MTVIDLGELRDEPEPRHSRSRRRVDRRWWLPMVLALTLSTVVAAAPPERPAGILLPVRFAGPVLVVADRLFVVDPANALPWNARHLQAFSLPTGSLRWQVPLPGTGRVAQLAHLSGTLLVGGHSDDSASMLTEAYDAADGRLRWRQPGRFQTVGDGTVLLHEVGALEDMTTLRLVETVGGTARWARTISGRTRVEHFVEAGGERLLLTMPTGRIEVWDAVSGLPLRAIDLGLKFAEPGGAWTHLAGDLLLVRESGAITGYGLAGLDRRWSVPLDAVDAYPVDCGPMICLHSRQGGVTAVDRATGQFRWTNADWAAITAAGDHLLAVSSARTVTEWALLDSATGAPRVELGVWQPAWSVSGGADPIEVLVRRRADLRLLVAELDVVGAEIRVRDVLAGVTTGCTTSGGWLFCERLDGRLGGWRLTR